MALTSPGGVDTTTGGSNGLPDWYQGYLQTIGNSALSLADSQANMDVPAMGVAGFNQDQLDSFQGVRDAQGNWKPYLQQAAGAAGSIQPGASSLVDKAQGAVAGPAQTWGNDAATKYMSPYTTQVVDNIQRLGLRNLNENLLPAVQGDFIGSGQFGSTRNADILGRTVRDANDDITGRMGDALNAGYTNAQTAFTSDANRQQQQQQLQGSTALQGAGALTAAGTAGAQQLGALGQATAGLSLNDSQALGAVGGQQQNLQQKGLDTSYTNMTNLNNFDWNTLNNLNSTVHGLQLPTNPIQTTSQPIAGGAYTTGNPLSQVGGALTAAFK
jgi:hypothetical protein